jgi:hypothetical protein
LHCKGTTIVLFCKHFGIFFQIIFTAKNETLYFQRVTTKIKLFSMIYFLYQIKCVSLWGNIAEPKPKPKPTMTDQEKQTIIKALNFTIKNCLCDASHTDPNYHDHDYSCVENESGTITFKHERYKGEKPATIVTGSVQGLVDVLNVNYPNLLNYALNQNQPHE